MKNRRQGGFTPTFFIFGTKLVFKMNTYHVIFNQTSENIFYDTHLIKCDFAGMMLLDNIGFVANMMSFVVYFASVMHF